MNLHQGCPQRCCSFLAACCPGWRGTVSGRSGHGSIIVPSIAKISNGDYYLKTVANGIEDSSWIADTFHNGSSPMAGMIRFVISRWYSRCVVGENVSFVASSHCVRRWPSVTSVPVARPPRLR